VLPDEHDDDLATTVEPRNGVETDDFPNATDESESPDETNARIDRDDQDANVGK
jgi:hypothetical protein